MTTANQNVATPCAKCPLRQLPVFSRQLVDVDVIQAFKIGELTVGAGGTILLRRPARAICLRYCRAGPFATKPSEDGRRQIINYALPGDFLGLQSSMSEVMGHGIEALTHSVLCVFPRATSFGRSSRTTRNSPMTSPGSRPAMSAASTNETLSLGRRTAIERIAYLLWFLFDKARGLGMTKRNRLDMPMRQSHLADTLGLFAAYTPTRPCSDYARRDRSNSMTGP